MDKIKIGIIGLGRFGIHYFKTLNELENVEVSWICATKKSTLKRALSQVDSKAKTTIDFKVVFKDNKVDAVAIVTPGSTHYILAKQALLAGKHVLVEKPLAFHAWQVEDLINIAKDNNKVLMVGHIHLYNPAIQRIKKDIKSLGKIRSILSIGFGGPIRKDMSALWDYFPHDLSIILYLLDSIPLNVNVHGASYLQKDIEDVITMNLRFPNGTFATAIGSWLYPIKKREMIIAGENGIIIFDEYSHEKLRYYDMDGTYTIPEFKNTPPLTIELNHFLDCIKNGKKPLTDGYEALKVVDILEKAEQSLRK